MKATKTGVKPGLPAAKYPVGIAAWHRFEKKRGRIIARKWSSKSGWWYEIRTPDGFQRSVPEQDVEPTED